MNEEEMSLNEQSICDRCFNEFDYNSDDLIWRINDSDYNKSVITAFAREPEADALCKKCIKELK